MKKVEKVKIDKIKSSRAPPSISDFNILKIERKFKSKKSNSTKDN